MNASLRALLSGVVDYAGLFPPAQLPLDQAIRNYARYRQEADAWMLGRFVIPVSRLLEWDAFADLFQAHSPCAFSRWDRTVIWRKTARAFRRLRRPIEDECEWKRWRFVCPKVESRPCLV